MHIYMALNPRLVFNKTKTVLLETGQMRSLSGGSVGLYCDGGECPEGEFLEAYLLRKDGSSTAWKFYFSLQLKKVLIKVAGRF